ncbi:YcdB/YcdC domain-containing protein [Brevibacillus panacihumi]|uniref:YcdB/YcdC domain-containing protein n=1 Tax=Brevibacillus panacihumi TaxID=497735 RepID=UPI003D044D52
MKKIPQSMIVLLAASLAVTAPLSASAASVLAAATQESSVAKADTKVMDKIKKGLEKANRLLPYLKDYPIMEVELSEKSQLIIVNKYQSEGNKIPKVTLSFDQETGELLGFLQVKGTKGFDSTYPPEKAKEVAIAFMKEWYGEGLGGYQVNEIANEGKTSVTFHKTVNGIPFRNDAVILRVNSEGHVDAKATDGHRKSVVLSKQPNIEFGDPKEALPKEQVEKMFASYMNPVYARDVNGQVKLLYRPKLGEIDARTGAFRESDASQSQIVKFQSKGQQPTAKTKEEAAAFLAAKTGYDMTKERAVFQEISEGKEINYLWQTDSGIIGSLYVDKQTKKITRYQVLDSKQKSESEKKLSPEQALQVAVTELSEYLPANITEMMRFGAEHYAQYDHDRQQYHFQFSLIHGGIPVEDSMVMVDVDAVTGKAVLLDWRVPDFGTLNASLPDPKKAISQEEAAKIYLQKHPLKLYYSMDEDSEKTASLVYVTTGENEVDALTGELYRYGQE